MKKCCICKQNLPLECFGKHSREKDGLCGECKSCKRTRDKNYRLKNKEKCQERSKKYYENNKEKIIAKTCLYSKENREKCNLSVNKRRLQIKTEVFSHYSGGEPCCKLCNNKDLFLLSIDHIAGNGSKHRQEIFGSSKSKRKGSGKEFYAWLKNNNYPEGFQVLCINCNYRKRMLEMQPKVTNKTKITRAAYIRKMKLDCLDNYGGRNCPCGETDIVVLTLDHVNNDGNKHRENKIFGSEFYRLLRKNGYPNDPQLQVLCINCNWKKRQFC